MEHWEGKNKLKLERVLPDGKIIKTYHLYYDTPSDESSEIYRYILTMGENEYLIDHNGRLIYPFGPPFSTYNNEQK